MSYDDQNKNLDRRTFLRKLSLVGGAGLVLLRSVLRAGTNARSQVCIVEDVAATNGTTINTATVGGMVPAQSLIVRFRRDVARYVDEIWDLSSYDTVSFSVKPQLSYNGFLPSDHRMGFSAMPFVPCANDARRSCVARGRVFGL